jgi:MFS family permease
VLCATVFVVWGWNMFCVGCWAVLGPVIADPDLGGDGAWAFILSAGGVGAVLGGVVAMRIRPRRPLVASVLAPLPMTLPLIGLALGLPVWAIVGLNLLGGIGLSVHLTLWFTVFQREIPERAQSRVSTYDALGSFVLISLGMAFVGPIAAVTGNTAALWLAVAVFIGSTAVIVAIPSVRAIRVKQVDQPLAPTMAPR